MTNLEDLRYKDIHSHQSGHSASCTRDAPKELNPKY